MVKVPYLDDFDLKGKRVILRVDINSPIEKKKVIMNDRIEEAAKSIKELQKRKAKVIVLAHQGRPGSDDFSGLSQHAKLLNKFVKIRFVPDIYGLKAEKEISNLKNGKVILLENVRTLKEEFDNSNENKFVNKLSSLADYYVNDAFSVSHREQASVTGFPKKLKSCFGPLIKKELESLDKIKMNNVLYILAGSKSDENFLFMQKGKKIIVAGLFGQLCLKAKGTNFGVQEKFLEMDKLEGVKKLVSELSLITPVDFAVKEKNKRKEIPIDSFPNNYEIFDIGEKTITKFEKEILNAKAIFMKGPCGYITDKKFMKGTERVLKAIIKSKAFSVIGGGHLTTAIKELKINKNKFNHISLSGGALASYVAGKKLPGIEAIR